MVYLISFLRHYVFSEFFHLFFLSLRQNLWVHTYSVEIIPSHFHVAFFTKNLFCGEENRKRIRKLIPLPRKSLSATAKSLPRKLCRVRWKTNSPWSNGASARRIPRLTPHPFVDIFVTDTYFRGARRNSFPRGVPVREILARCESTAGGRRRIFLHFVSHGDLSSLPPFIVFSCLRPLLFCARLLGDHPFGDSAGRLTLATQPVTKRASCTPCGASCVLVHAFSILKLSLHQKKAVTEFLRGKEIVLPVPSSTAPCMRRSVLNIDSFIGRRTSVVRDGILTGTNTNAHIISTPFYVKGRHRKTVEYLWTYFDRRGCSF